MKTVKVIQDEITKTLSQSFDYEFDGTTKFNPPHLPSVPQEYGIGLIVGASGSGKSTLLEMFGKEENIEWNPNLAICSQFNNADEAEERLSSVGFNSIPSWMRPYHVLSTGEKFRADLARKLKPNAVIDEFTSVIDRNVAKAASVSLVRYVKNNDISNVVLSTCHRDILDWLEPDWVIDTDTGEFHQGFFLSNQKSKSKYIEQVIISGPCLKTIII
jgi:ABC-type ATPase with predicted acetyltransferase domain